jgi:hypothetical protein
MIDLEHARVGELRQAQRAAVVARAEEHELFSGERTGDVVDHARAHLHVQDPALHAGHAREHGRHEAALDHPRELQRRERGAVRVVRDPDTLGQQPAEVTRAGDPRGGAARRVVFHEPSFFACARGRSTIWN